MRLAAIADLSADRALAALERTGVPHDRYDATMTMSFEEGVRGGRTIITTDSAAMIARPEIDVVLEITGNPAAGIRHVLMVHSRSHNVGPLLIQGSVASTRSTL